MLAGTQGSGAITSRDLLFSLAGCEDWTDTSIDRLITYSPGRAGAAQQTAQMRVGYGHRALWSGAAPGEDLLAQVMHTGL